MLERTAEWYEKRLKSIERRKVREAKPLVNKRQSRKKYPASGSGDKVWKNWKRYESITRWITRNEDLSSVINIHLRDKDNYHLDHVVSVWDGYLHNINPRLIGRVENLRIISASENREKAGKSPIDAILELIELNKIYIHPDGRL